MKVVWSKQALDEKEAIWDFLAGTDPDYADRVELRLERRADSLSHLPRQGRSVSDHGMRCLSIPDIQLVFHYSIAIEEGAVRILSVRSTAQGEER